MTDDDPVAAFLAAGPFAVAGASTNRDKYGNKVLRAYLQNDLEVHPINPKAREVEGVRAVPDVQSLPDGIGALSIVTPPAVTEAIVESAHEKGIRHLWMQPGAESQAAVERAQELGLEVISGGPCLLVVLKYRE